MSETDIFQCIRQKDLQGIKAAVKKDPQIINAVDSRGFTLLILATYYDLLELSKFLLDNGADINAQDASGNTALMGGSRPSEVVEMY
jgi:ankyrin repeat protein